jgi:hypothetical protein
MVPVPETARVNLYWLPLGAGGHSVRLNGRVFEWFAARFEHRDRSDLVGCANSVPCPDLPICREIEFTNPTAPTAATTRAAPGACPRASTFFMGDNRSQSWDSRWSGTVPCHDLIGNVVEIKRASG